MLPVIRVLGLGSSHGDDQIGWRLVEDLRGVEARLLQKPLEIVDHLQGCHAVVLVDGCRSGSRPGTVTVLRSKEGLDGYAGCSSTHGMGVVEVLRLAEALGRALPELVVFGVEVGECQAGTGLSPELASALPVVRDKLEAVLSSLRAGEVVGCLRDAEPVGSKNRD